MNNFRSWLDKERFHPNGMLTRDYAAVLTEFMHVSMNQESCLKIVMMFCPCPYFTKYCFTMGIKNEFHVGSSSGNASERVEESIFREDEVCSTQMIHDANGKI
ncbi:hypothetical protein CARUB_v10028213mg [Capsella rubella]|uniref:Uncharacterized protein n=1 Tax=Capsella rubella TaxID=81985 RepID=R0GRB2_9BRAS|nr:hypothetical protein CARUB_v10028213mg [Capsella rubella]